MTGLLFTGDLNTKAGREAYRKRVMKYADDPGMRDVMLRLTESLLINKDHPEKCPYKGCEYVKQLGSNKANKTL
jgi:hypothetical protein